MITIRDYARDNGVSYEAVRKKIKRYSEDLEGHVHQRGRTQYLDDEAVAFLQQHKAEAPLVIYDGAAAEDVRLLRNKVEALQEKLIAAQELALASQSALVEAQAARMALAAAEDQRDQMAAAAEKAHLEAAAARAEAEALREALSAAEARERFLKDRSWWERLTRRGEQ